MRSPKTFAGRFAAVIAVAAGICGIASLANAMLIHASVRHFVGGQLERHGDDLLLVGAVVVVVSVLFVIRARLRTRGKVGKQLREWAKQESAWRLDMLPLGAQRTGSREALTLRHYASGRVLIEPPFTVLAGRQSHSRLLHCLRHAVGDSRRVLVRAEPGQGKTLLMQLVYLSLLDDLKAHPHRARIPLLVPLSSCTLKHTDERGLRTAIIETHSEVHTLLSRLPARERHPDRYVVLLDGLDELQSAFDEPGHATALVSALIAAADIVTSRDSFLEFRLEVPSAFPTTLEIRLDPLAFDESCRRYIRNYCAIGGGDPDRVIEQIDTTPGLFREIVRPLLLFMTVDVLAHPPEDAPSRPVVAWNATHIYKTYVDKWLQAEVRRPPRVMELPGKQAATEMLAWELFKRSGRSSPAWGLVDISDLRVHADDMTRVIDTLLRRGRIAGERDALIADLRERCFLIRAAPPMGWEQSTIQYCFPHKSFFEYLLAVHVVNTLGDGPQSVEDLDDLLSLPFPDQVIQFIRQSLTGVQDDQPDRAREVARNLTLVLNKPNEMFRRGVHLAPNYRPTGIDPEREMARQQAGNLLPLVVAGNEVRQLERRARTEESDLVRRGIAVGLALHHEIVGPIEAFVELMEMPEHGRNALSSHIGYSRIYYGDQKRTSNWLDDGSEYCAAFYAKTLAHLSDPAKYQHLWSMTVFTLRWLLSSDDRYVGEPSSVRQGAHRALEVCQSMRGRSQVLDQQIAKLEDVVAARWQRDPAQDAVAPS